MQEQVLKETREYMLNSTIPGSAEALSHFDAWLKNHLFDQFFSKVQNDPLKKSPPITCGNPVDKPSKPTPKGAFVLHKLGLSPEELPAGIAAPIDLNLMDLNLMDPEPAEAKRVAHAIELTHSISDVWPEFANESAWRIVEPPKPSPAKVETSGLGKPLAPIEGIPIQINGSQFWKALEEYRRTNQFSSAHAAVKSLGLKSLSNLGGLSSRANHVVSSKYGAYLIEKLGNQIRA